VVARGSLPLHLGRKPHRGALRFVDRSG
jgi:hypothetical protein